jgi:hypothetical protein
VDCAAAVLRAADFAGAFFAVAFRGAACFAVTFRAGAFFAVTFRAGAFFAATLRAGAFFAVGVLFFAAVRFTGARLAATRLVTPVRPAVFFAAGRVVAFFATAIVLLLTEPGRNRPAGRSHSCSRLTLHVLPRARHHFREMTRRSLQ